MKQRKQRIKGAKRTKGRYISGHSEQIENRTFQDTIHMEAIDRQMRKWRAEPKLSGGPSPEVHHLLERLRGAISGVDGRLLPVASSDCERPRKTEPVAAKGPGKTVERTWGGWIYTISWPSGEIIDKRREV